MDYVQCREMLRTKNESIEKAALYQGDSNLAYVQAKCGIYQAGSGDEVRDAYSACTKAAHRLRIVTNKQTKLDPIFYEGWPWESKSLDNSKAIGFYKVALRVAYDMKKSGCPYQ